MKDIVLHNKKFQPFITDKEIASIINRIANEINKTQIEKPLFIAILNGSFLFAADIMREIHLSECEISFVKLSSYTGTESTGKVAELIGLNHEISERNIIILEDIIDTGFTLEKVINILNKKNAGEVKIATLLFKPNAYKKNRDIHFIGKSIPNDFVVGYGLDYNNLGRNLPHIYKLKN